MRMPLVRETMARRQLQPLNRQAERYAKKGIEISLSTLADQVGDRAVALQPIHELIRAHVAGMSSAPNDC
jgi:transposase